MALLYGMRRMQGVDVNLALNQQRPAPDQPLIMQPNLLAGQVHMPARWEVNDKDEKFHPILVPSDKRQTMDKLDQMAIFFPVQKDKQSVPVPKVLVQHQGLLKEQIEAIHNSMVSAVPMAQE